MLHDSNSAAGIAVNSAPGLLYVACRYLIELPIEKWVSGATLLFIALQMAFLLWDRMAKHGKRGRK